MVQAHHIPGLAIAVIRDGAIYYQKYNGLASIEDQDSVDQNTIFRIYSATKLMTSAGLFQLLEKHKIKLEDKISDYLNWLPEA